MGEARRRRAAHEIAQDLRAAEAVRKQPVRTAYIVVAGVAAAVLVLGLAMFLLHTFVQSVPAG